MKVNGGYGFVTFLSNLTPDIIHLKFSSQKTPSLFQRFSKKNYIMSQRKQIEKMDNQPCCYHLTFQLSIDHRNRKSEIGNQLISLNDLYRICIGATLET